MLLGDAFDAARHHPVSSAGDHVGSERKRPTVKSSLVKRCVRVGAVLGVASGFAATNATPAQAVVPPGQVVVSAAGSDTTEKVMNAILNGVNQYNIPAVPGVTSGSANFLVPGDAACIQDVTWVAANPSPPAIQLAPNGSGSGRTYLGNEQAAAAGQKGCVDIARSSSPPRTVAAGDKASFEYYAFALDAVAWATPSLAAPGTITKQQLKDIYACNITDWSQLPGGGTGAIQRYLPQAGSGTRSFFISDMLDNITIPATGTNCPAVVEIEENKGNQIRTADYQKAILPYSAGTWVYQANNSVNPTLDLRKGVRLGGIITAPVATNASAVAWNGSDGAFQLNTGTGPLNVVNEANVKVNDPAPDYPGVRYVFNILDNLSPNYAEAAALVGFDNVGGGTKSPLCSNGKLSPILSFGFGPLSTAGNPGGNTNLAGATCRKFVPAAS